MTDRPQPPRRYIVELETEDDAYEAGREHMLQEGSGEFYQGFPDLPARRMAAALYGAAAGLQELADQQLDGVRRLDELDDNDDGRAAARTEQDR